MTIFFVAFSFALAFWQRPGWATSDTKIDLHVDPSRFLQQVASVWTVTTDLGEVHSAQYSGYLWPMGPFFAAFHAIGLGAWVVQRMWLGLMFALSVWGMLRLLDVLIGRPRGVVHFVATSFYLLNPYTVVFTARTSITLLGYAALPWLLLVSYHGIRAIAARTREPPPQPRPGLTGRLASIRWRPWWWAAAFALILTSTGGGVNAAVVGWMLVGPLVLLLYEAAIGNARWRDAGGFLIRVGILSVLASLWWIVPLLVHVRYGIDFLQFTEQPATIWGTNSSTEALRLMGYWTSYIGVGFGVLRPFFSDGATMLFNPWVVGASVLLPGLALAGFVAARNRGYGPFLLALVVVGAVIEVAGFPDGTPLRGAMDWVYHHVFVLRFMRTTNKAAPLVAVGLAGLLGLGAEQALTRLRSVRAITARRLAIAAAGVALATLVALAALPLLRGGALDTQLSWKRIPAPWVAAGRGLDRDLPKDARAMVLPGQIFAYYNWGGTLDAILPRLTSRPVAVRYETPYSDLHAVDLMTTVDDLVQQRRLVSGELTPLLQLMGVRSVVTGTDDDTSRSGAMAPAAAAGALAGQGLGAPARSYGTPVAHSPAPGDIGADVRLPEVRRYDIPPGRGIVHVDPAGPATIVDGGAQSLADLAAFGRLPAQQPVLYAGDLTAGALRSQAAAGANLVVGDSNRRRLFLPESTQQNRGVTLGAGDPIPAGAAVLNPFPNAGSDGQTVSVVRGARYLYAPTEPGELQFPEHAPIAAFDGDLSTAWIADRNLPVFDRWIEVGFNAPRDVPYVDLYALSDTHGVVTEVDVNGVHSRVHPGLDRIAVHLHAVRRLRVTIDHVVQPKTGLGGPGGFKEIRIPGLDVKQMLRAPIVVGRQLAGADLRHDSLSYVFERTTGDDPFRRQPFSGTTVLNDPKVRGDAEAQIDRIVFAPAARTYTAAAWAYPAVGTADSTLDRLAGYTGAEVFNSSARFQDQPGYRASSAFGAPGGPGWIGVWQRPDMPAPWISWSGPRALTLSRLVLTPSSLVVRRPTVVALSWPGGSSGPLGVGANGVAVLPRPVRARAFRLTILAAAFPAGATQPPRASQAVGIGSLLVPGIPQARVPVTGPLRAGCGSVSIEVGGRALALRPSATVEQLDAGQPLPARACGGRGGSVSIGAGVQEVRTLRGPFSIDLLQLSSAAPAPVPTAATGRVIDSGQIGNSSVSGVRVALTKPAWLVLGESYDSGWRASCDGRLLGVPQVIDGYANGWIAPVSCDRVTFSFAPQAGVRTSYAISAVVCALLILFLLIGALRQPALASAAAIRRRLADPPATPTPPLQAIGIALALAIPIAFVFAIRAGLVAFPLLAFVLWRGYGPRTLAIAAAALLGIVVPITYALTQPRNRGGYSFAYATDLIAAHWIGVTVIVLCAMTVWMMLSRRAR